MYRVSCACGFRDEEFMASLKQRESDVACPSCAAPLTFHPGGARAIGVIFSNALDLSAQHGVVLDSNAAVRDFEATHKTKLVSTSGSEWRKIHDDARAGAERQARKLGFRDLDERRQHMKRERARGGSR